MKEERVCPTCNDPFLSYTTKGNQRTYCSSECVPKTPKVSGICKGCGKEFLRYPSQVQNYCRNPCKKPRTQYLEYTCENCGKQCETHPSSPRRFCSRRCQKEGTRVNTICPECNKAFWYHRSWPRKYCSRKCSAANNAKNNLGIIELPPKFCEQCGEEITKDKRQGRRFCSHRCFGDWQSANKRGDNHPSFNQVERVCLHCKQTFFAAKNEVAKGWGKYCSRQCKHDSGRTLRMCRQCGHKFNAPKNQVANTKGGGSFCSKECRRQWQVENPPQHALPVYNGAEHPNWSRVRTNCTHCGISFDIAPSRIANSSSGNVFCDADCYHAWYSENLSGENSHGWKGGKKSWRGASWKRQRRLALKRDNHICQHCGITEKKLGRCLDVHHLTPFREFGLERHEEANDLRNLISLCQSCHQRAEHGVIPIQPYLLCP